MWWRAGELRLTVDINVLEWRIWTNGSIQGGTTVSQTCRQIVYVNIPKIPKILILLFLWITRWKVSFQLLVNTANYYWWTSHRVQFVMVERQHVYPRYQAPAITIGAQQWIQGTLWIGSYRNVVVLHCVGLCVAFAQNCIRGKYSMILHVCVLQRWYCATCISIACCHFSRYPGLNETYECHWFWWHCLIKCLFKTWEIATSLIWIQRCHPTSHQH